MKWQQMNKKSRPGFYDDNGATTEKKGKKKKRSAKLYWGLKSSGFTSKR
jgi:hypothetical protein